MEPVVVERFATRDGGIATAFFPETRPCSLVVADRDLRIHATGAATPGEELILSLIARENRTHGNGGEARR